MTTDAAATAPVPPSVELLAPELLPVPSDACFRCGYLLPVDGYTRRRHHLATCQARRTALPMCVDELFDGLLYGIVSDLIDTRRPDDDDPAGQDAWDALAAGLFTAAGAAAGELARLYSNLSR